MSHESGRSSSPGPPPLVRRRSFAANIAPLGSPGVTSVRSAPANIHFAPGSPGASSVKSHVSQLSNASSSTSIAGSVSISNILALTICPICFLPPLNPQALITPCGHTFCSSCLNKWADHGPGGRNYVKCPSCRKSFRKANLTRNIMIENLLEQVLGLEANDSAEDQYPPPVAHPPSTYLPVPAGRSNPPPPPLPRNGTRPNPPLPPAPHPTSLRAGVTPVPRNRQTENHLLLMGRIRQLNTNNFVDESAHGQLMRGIRAGRQLRIVNYSRSLYTRTRNEGRQAAGPRRHTEPVGQQGRHLRTTLLEQIRLGRNRVFESNVVQRSSSGGDSIYPPFYAGGS